VNLSFREQGPGNWVVTSASASDRSGHTLHQPHLASTCTAPDTHTSENMAELGLDEAQVGALRTAFNSFDTEGKGHIDMDTIGNILRMMGVKVTAGALKEIVDELDESGNGLLGFDQFAELAAKFLVEEDEEELKKELTEAFRIYDKEGQGFITNDTLKEILREIDPKLTESDLDGIIEEVDEDGSGTMDLDEFMEMMSG